MNGFKFTASACYSWKMALNVVPAVYNGGLEGITGESRRSE
jgi:hypothetical protein